MDERLDSLPCGFVSFTDDGAIVAVNQTLLDLVGYARAEVEGRHVETLLSPGGRVFYQTHFYPLLKMQGQIGEIYLVLRARDERVIPVLAYATHREGRNDCIFIQVTSRERYQDEIARARELVIGILGHDLRVPLTSVTLGAETLLRHEQLSQEGQEIALSVLASARRAARMTTDLLDFARARFAGGIPIQPRPCDLRQVAEKIVAELRTIHPHVPIELSIEGDCRGVWDADRAAQVVANLTGNAIDHRHGETPVVVRLLCEEASVVLEVGNVADTAAQPDPDQLFSPFRLGPASSGLGLGLFIVREIMEAHGGSVKATNAAGEFRVRATWPRGT